MDNPYDYGTIAVANALSDVYAMGGKPLLALNIVGFPVELPIEILGEVLKGGAEKAREAGVLIVGGHTIDDKEPKYGLAVTGIIRPGSQITNAGAQEGDHLILTKPLGTGVITTAAKNEGASEEILRRAVEVMNLLNKVASEIMVGVGVHACTDVTGFGLIGHLLGMTKGSKVSARLYLSEIPFIQGVRELVEAGHVPGGTGRNMESAAEWVRWSEDITSEDQILMCDAQTSGGLLIAVDRSKSPRLLDELHTAGISDAKVIGEVVASTKNSIEVMP